MQQHAGGTLPNDIERSVSLAEMRAGIALAAAQNVVLIVRDLGLPPPNLHVLVELPDGSDYARNRAVALEIPGQSPILAVTNADGELRLSVPNQDAHDATLKLLDGAREVATWAIAIHADESVASAR